MAVNWSFVRMMDAWGMFRPGMRVLDIGSSNLYHAPADEVAAFLRRHNPRLPAADAARAAERIAEGAYVDPVTGARNQAFLGEVLEPAGIVYLAFDIAVGYKTEVADLNSYTLPQRHRNAFDLVLNFGTTEHIVHQFNSFKVIHEATRPGGVMWHQLPAGGYVDHCYFTYHPRFFLDLALANGYELDRYWVSVGGMARVFDGLSDYAPLFPAVADFLANPAGRPQRVENVETPDVGINAVYRKHHDRPFRASIERSTSVGDVPASVMRAYEGEAAAEPAAPPSLARRVWGAVPGPLKPVLRPLARALAGRR